MLLKVRFKSNKMETIEAFLTLVRLGIGNPASKLPQRVNWPAIQELATNQGLYAIVLDGVEKLPAEQRPPQELLLEWIGEVLQGYEYRYDAYKQTIAEMAGFYNSHGLKMMVLKGYACSLNWPKPNHRPCGDIDIWQFGKLREADEFLNKEKGIKVDDSLHHHTCFYWGEFMVENHYDFVNVHTRQSNAELEKVFKRLGDDDKYYAELFGERVCLPSPNLHALFLIKHTVSHFASSNINLRQVLDWAFFVANHHSEVDWEWLLELLRKYHMSEFFKTINAICVDDLGFESKILPCVQFIPRLKDKVLSDIIAPAYVTAEPRYLFPRLWYKYRRWQGNAWKQKLCYKENRWNLFLKGLWSHLLKPTSI